MSTVIHFLDRWKPRLTERQSEPATIIVLPVVMSFEAAERLERRRRVITESR